MEVNFTFIDIKLNQLRHLKINNKLKMRSITQNRREY